MVLSHLDAGFLSFFSATPTDLGQPGQHHPVLFLEIEGVGKSVTRSSNTGAQG